MCSAKDLQFRYGAQDLLALIHRARSRRRFRSSNLVGAGRDHSDRIHLLVAGLPQRLVRVSRFALRRAAIHNGPAAFSNLTGERMKLQCKLSAALCLVLTLALPIIAQTTAAPAPTTLS